MDIGPLQLLVIGFPSADFRGEILDELDRLYGGDTLRVVDLLGVYKDEEGDLTVAQMSDLSIDEKMTYGAFLGALIGVGAAGEEGAVVGALEGALVMAEEMEYGLDLDAVDSIAEDIPLGGAALVAVIEHLWAIPLRDAVRRAGGLLIAQDFLSPEALIATGALLSEAYAEEE